MKGESLARAVRALDAERLHLPHHHLPTNPHLNADPHVRDCDDDASDASSSHAHGMYAPGPPASSYAPSEASDTDSPYAQHAPTHTDSAFFGYAGYAGYDAMMMMPPTAAFPFPPAHYHQPYHHQHPHDETARMQQMVEERQARGHRRSSSVPLPLPTSASGGLGFFPDAERRDTIALPSLPDLGGSAAPPPPSTSSSTDDMGWPRMSAFGRMSFRMSFGFNNSALLGGGLGLGEREVRLSAQERMFVGLGQRRASSAGALFFPHAYDHAWYGEQQTRERELQEEEELPPADTSLFSTDFSFGSSAPGSGSVSSMGDDEASPALDRGLVLAPHDVGPSPAQGPQEGSEGRVVAPQPVHPLSPIQLDFAGAEDCSAVGPQGEVFGASSEGFEYPGWTRLSHPFDAMGMRFDDGMGMDGVEGRYAVEGY